MLDLEPIKALLASAPRGVTEADGLTWTRLGEEGGALHTGGGGGIVYADCRVAGLTATPDRDPVLDLIAAAPALLAAAVAELAHHQQLQGCGCWDKGDGVCDRCDAALVALGLEEPAVPIIPASAIGSVTFTTPGGIAIEVYKARPASE